MILSLVNFPSQLDTKIIHNKINKLKNKIIFSNNLIKLRINITENNILSLVKEIEITNKMSQALINQSLIVIKIIIINKKNPKNWIILLKLQKMENKLATQFKKKAKIKI